MTRRLVRIDESGNKCYTLATKESPWKEIEQYLQTYPAESFTLTNSSGKFIFQLEEQSNYTVQVARGTQKAYKILTTTNWNKARQRAIAELENTIPNTNITVTIKGTL